MARKTRLLLVDDENDFLLLARTFLRKLNSNLHVVPVSSPFDALEQVTSHAFDIVVSDHDMPGMTGLELLVTLRKTSTIPFVMLTGKGEELARQAISSGADYFLQKRNSPADLFTELVRVIEFLTGQLDWMDRGEYYASTD